jgi:drug/metabolite transporter (DMT)-like permease
MSLKGPTAIASILFACAAYAAFNVADAAIKALGGRFHFSEVVFIDSALTLLFLAAYGAWSEGKRAFISQAWGSVFLRAGFLQIMAVCEILSLPHVQLTTFYTIVFTSPFQVALMAALFLKEPLGWRRLGIIAAGFAVILLVFRPGGGLLNIYVPVTLIGAFCYSAQLIATRKLAQAGKEEGACCVFIATFAVGLVWSAFFMPAHYVTPTGFEWLMYFVYSVFATLGFIAINHAFRIAPAAALLAPCHYTQLGWAALIGWLAFGDVPEAQVIAGAAVLIFLGLYFFWTETKAHKIP